MQPNSPSCANALNRAADQRVRSLEDHVVTQRFPVFRGAPAGPLRAAGRLSEFSRSAGDPKGVVGNPTPMHSMVGP